MRSRRSASKAGTPWFQLKELAEKLNIFALSSNYAVYGDMSNRVMAIRRDYGPNVETYFIGESFLSLNGLSNLWPAGVNMGPPIRDRVRK